MVKSSDFVSSSVLVKTISASNPSTLISSFPTSFTISSKAGITTPVNEASISPSANTSAS